MGLTGPTGFFGRVVALVLFGVVLALVLFFSFFIFFILLAGVAVGLLVFFWRTRGRLRPGDEIIEVVADEVSEGSPADFRSRP